MLLPMKPNTESQTHRINHPVNQYLSSRCLANSKGNWSLSHNANFRNGPCVSQSIQSECPKKKTGMEMCLRYRNTYVQTHNSYGCVGLTKQNCNKNSKMKIKERRRVKMRSMDKKGAVGCETTREEKKCRNSQAGYCIQTNEKRRKERKRRYNTRWDKTTR